VCFADIGRCLEQFEGLKDVVDVVLELVTARVLDLLHDHQVVARQVVANTLQCEMLDHRREQTRDVVLVESQRVRHLLLAEGDDGGVLEVSVEGLRGGRGHGLDLLLQLLRGDPGGVWVHRLGKGLHGRLLLVCRLHRLDVQDVDCFLVLLSLLLICISIVLLFLVIELESRGQLRKAVLHTLLVGGKDFSYPASSPSWLDPWAF